MDVAFNIEGLFLGIGISVKVVGLPEAGHGYGHNFKRLSEEWTLETVNYHRYMPYSVIVGLLFLPSNCVNDRPQRSSLSRALDHFRGYRGRLDHRGDPDLMEEIYVGVYEPTGGAGKSKKGAVYFVSAEHSIPSKGPPASALQLTFDDVKDHLVRRFKARNPRLRVKGMP